MGLWRRLLPLLHRHLFAKSSELSPPAPFQRCISSLNRNDSICTAFPEAVRCRFLVGFQSDQHLQKFLVRDISTSTAPSRSPQTEGNEQPVRSPLTMVPTPSKGGNSKGGKKTAKKEEEKRAVQAVIKKIKQSPKKVNLVAALVRGMRVQDALLQLAVTQKRAADTVKNAVVSARANASFNHGLDRNRLFIAEAFVGKGKYLRRLSYHAKGKSGIMHHPSCRLTIIVKEMSPEQEAELARYKTMTFKERAKFKSKLVPHKLIETSWQWYRTPKEVSSSAESSTSL